MNKHLDDLITRYPILKACEKDIEGVFHVMAAAFGQGNKLLICGNGGSAADAEHWAGELLKGFESLRPVDEADRERLPKELADKLQQALPVIPLTGFPSLQTAFANDVDPQLNFAQLTYGLGNENDVIVGISTSGNSRSVTLAMQTASAMGLTTIGLTGATGGKLIDLCDHCICVPETVTRIIQELHLPVYHALCLMLEDEFFG